MIEINSEPQRLPYVYGQPKLSGILRQSPETFRVEEILGFAPQGEGEHVFLFIEKRNLNTQQVASALARTAGIQEKRVSYAGMKDRNAVTRQWFSVHLPGLDDVDFSVLNSDNLKVLQQKRHLRKLRRGAHRGNQFDITIADIVGDRRFIAERIAQLSSRGFPNYFGEQRFGRDGLNVQKAQAWFAGEFKPKKHPRGLYLSAVRSFIFNQILAKRVRENSWDQLSSGELLMLNGSHSVFLQSDEEDLAGRIASGDVHPTGLMAGKASSLVPGGETAETERQVLASYPELAAGLLAKGLEAQRRSLRVMPGQLEFQIEDNALHLSFHLPSGSFATSLLREVVNYTEQ